MNTSHEQDTQEQQEEQKVTLEFTASEIALLMNGAALSVAMMTGDRTIGVKAIPLVMGALADVGISNWNALGERVHAAVEAAFPDRFRVETMLSAV